MTRQDQIHDALLLLDDDMITAVDDLRRQRTRVITHRMRWVYAAACLCIIFMSLFTIQILWPSHRLSPFSESAPSNSSSHLQPAGVLSSISVQIDQWQENGFSGTVTDAGDVDTLAAGEKITVLFADDLDQKDQEVYASNSEEHVKKSAEFPAGSIVQVQIASLEIEPADGTDIAQPAGGQLNDCIIYADTITHVDTSHP